VAKEHGLDAWLKRIIEMKKNRLRVSQTSKCDRDSTVNIHDWRPFDGERRTASAAGMTTIPECISPEVGSHGDAGGPGSCNREL
jgi:hypothetical protein